MPALDFMPSVSYRFHAAATAENEAAIDRYVSESETAAIRFVDAVERALDEAVSSPQRFPRVSTRHGRAVLRPFPFSIVFIEGEAGIIIIAIAHAKRRPGYWTRRTP